MHGVEQIQQAQRATWALCSAGWDKWDQVICDQLAPVGAAIMDSLNINADQQHLDIASGTGEPGLSIARLSPRGRVVLTDLAPEMLEVAERRAQSLGLTTIETQVCSADDLPFDDDSFGSVSVRFGYMFFPAMASATAEFVRVLRPGGRVCSSVWIKPERNPWTSIAMHAIGAELALPNPDPDGPSMFRCARPGQVSALYDAAGLRDVAEWDVEVVLTTESAEQYWDVVSEHVSSAVVALASVDESTRDRIGATVIARARAYEEDGKVRVPGIARCIVGTKSPV